MEPIDSKAFELIPAIDLKGGHCVRLRQGRMDEATDYGDDPAAMAGHWQTLGARRLHVVDLDGAFAGRPITGRRSGPSVPPWTSPCSSAAVCAHWT